MSAAKHLESVEHYYASTIGIDIVYKSRCNIPEVFLRGCGVPDEFIAYISSMVARPMEISELLASVVSARRVRRMLGQMRRRKVWY